MEQYRTEEEQVEALKRWWDENGKATIAASLLALVAGCGWQGWQGFQQEQLATASDSYQRLLQAMSTPEAGEPDTAAAREIAGQIKKEYGGSTYAQFAALHLARMAVNDADLATAEAELRWVLAKADAGSDIAQITQLRLARVLASSGDATQALTLLDAGADGDYAGAYAMARGDVFMMQGDESQARAAYSEARVLAAADATLPPLATLEQKLQSLNPQAPEMTGTAADEG